MARNDKSLQCKIPDPTAGGFKVESVVSVDERGQMVLPKDLRARAGIAPGDKLALVSWEKDGQVCCMSLIRAEAFSEMVKDMLGPMLAEITADR